MKTLSAVYRGNRMVELSDNLDIPKDTAVLVVIPDQNDEVEMHNQLQSAAQSVFAKIWDNEKDEVWNDYL